LLVDGVPWYDGVYTSAMIDDSFPMSHIRQVEVIKGPGSAIYGTNAFAAVINVVTRDGNAIDGAYARWMVGSRGRSDALLSVGGRTRAGGLEVDAAGYVRLLGQLGDGLDVTPRNRHDINGLDVKDGVAVGGTISVE